MVCSKELFLGRKTSGVSCIYFDLESGKRRPRNRLKLMLGDLTPPDNLYIITGDQNVGRLGGDFENTLNEQLRIHPDVKLVVVDVFQHIRREMRRNQTAYTYDYSEIEPLKKIAEQNRISLIVVHHSRKAKDLDDVFNNMNASTGLLAAVDFCWMIDREKRSSEESTLNITGKDVDEGGLSIRFNKKTYRWEYLGTHEEITERKRLEEYNQSNVIQTIKRLVQQNQGQWSGTASDVISASRYLGCEIYDSVQKAGNIINQYSDLLSGIDGIDFRYERNGKTRKYVFHSSV